jgi:ABC-type multidrug transport system fused ATPase/permease subunit
LLFIIAGPAVLFIRKQRKKLNVISSDLKTKYPLALKHVLQTIEGYVEIKTHNKQSFFINRFRQSHQALTNTLASEHGSTTIASRSTEAFAAICVSLLIGYALASGMSFQHTLLLLSLYAGISFRIIPSINRTLAAFLQIRTHEYVISELKEMTTETNSGTNNQLAKPVFNLTVELKNINVGYQRGTAVLKNISLQIRRGEKVIITGKSGAGKTTLLHVLLGFLKPQKGSILLDGVPLTDGTSLRDLMGYVPQNPFILDASISENIAFGVNQETIDQVKIEKILRELELFEWATALPERFNTIIGEKGVRISGGQRQRLAIARVLYNESQILLLDEITNQLDQQTEKEIMRIIEKIASENKTIIMISHRPHAGISFDCVYRITDGYLERISELTDIASNS